MYSFFIGSDVSKDKIDVSFRNLNGCSYLGVYENSIDGFRMMLKELQQHSKDPVGSWLFCFENTGPFSKSLFEWLFSNGIPCLEECPIKIKKSLGLKRGKDDKADSKAICQYAFEKRDSIKPQRPDKPLITTLKGYISRRALLVKTKTSLSNSVKHNHLSFDKEMVDFIKTQNDTLLNEIEKQIQEIELSITELLNCQEEVKINNTLIRSVVGIGPVLAAKLIATTNNFENFDNARQYACYTGIAPFPNRSGKVVKRNSISHHANKEMKALLSIAVFAAITHDPDLKTYYKRKVAEGKPKGVVRNAVKNKMIQRVFSVVNRKSPYVKLMQYAS